ncbi:MAG TPA: sigma-70 family RNA polymerase sigma factor, partial [Acetobacteraceae bacterium]|nr:sigma-70 family RNA polymerase sigma factor [Acetobacteraceae bacterium]
MGDAFHAELVALLPKLRGYARLMTGSPAAADDLVQETVVNALAGRESFVPGTNLPAWLSRILRNTFVSELRRTRTASRARRFEAPDITPGSAEDQLVLRRLSACLPSLPPEQREALLLTVLDGLSYEAMAERQEVPVGTVKCRVHRARQSLHRMLLDDQEARRPRRLALKAQPTSG